ncbi:MAG: hypothetical protein J6B10_03065 [Lachnospiraceae bacterium]|nr:hypothetical protein [Lachnospiraceae bacterium]
MKYIIGSLVIVAAVFAVGTRLFRTQAVFDGEGVHIDAEAEQNSMLIIGTHLIHLSSLTDELYQIAETSASDSNQMNRYYKSELADGKWIDITDAASLSDIMETGAVVDDEEIEALYLTHRTGADGITHDLRTGRTVSVFDIRPLYDLESLPELEPLKLQYDMLSQSEGGDDTEKRNRKLIRNFFEETNTRDSETARYDRQLEALQIYYTVLCQYNAPQQEREAVQEVLGKLDSSRRAVVYEKVSESLQVLESQVGDTQTEDEEESYRMDQALMTAIQDSDKNLAESIIEAQGNELNAGDTVMGSLQYQISADLISQAEAGNHTACDGDVQELLKLQRIMASEIYDQAGELALLEEKLLPQMDDQYTAALSMGVSQEYREAVQKNSSHVILENIMSRDTAAYDIDRNELQFYIQAAVERMEKDAAQEYVKQRMERVESFGNAIPSDEFEQTAQTSVESHLLWLQKLLSDIAGGNTGVPLDRLYEEKADLQEQLLQALDDLDMDAANRLEARIAAKEDEIQKAAGEQEARLNELYEKKAALESSAGRDDAGTKSQIAALERQIAIAGAELKDGTEASNIQQLKNDAKTVLQSKTGSQEELVSLEASLDGLISLLGSGSSMAGNVLKELYKDMVSASFLSDKTEYDDLIEKTEEAVAQYSDVIRPVGKTLSPTQALAVLETALGGNIQSQTAQSGAAREENGQGTASDKTAVSETNAASENPASPEEMLAAVMALAAYGASEDDSQLEQSAATLAASLEANTDLCIFKQKSGDGFVSVSALAAYTGYRYLWNDTKKTAILSKGSSYYQFTAFQKQVKRETDITEEMESAAGYGGVLYLPPEYVFEQFGCRAYAIEGTEYAVLAEEDIIETSEQLTELLLRQTQ